MFKRVLALFVALCTLFANVYANEEQVNCKSALLMDFESGKVLYKMNPHERLPLASVTKIMTLLLTMEEIQNGNLNYSDIVTASAYAKSMGGSTIFLDENENMSVDDLLKGICVASGNDACVAIAEHISGSCDAFVERMNQRAKELGMTNTNFVNCNGLDAQNHYSSAYDIALMSRELMKHNDIFRYTTIWMDSLRNGKFTLTNTNKLVRFYEGTTGLKTGSTSKAGFCISATAKRNGLHLICVVMNSPTSQERQKTASSILNYGFSTYSAQKVIKKEMAVKDITVNKGLKSHVGISYANDIRILTEKNSKAEPILKYDIKKSIDAPAYKGTCIGTVTCEYNGEIVGRSDIILNESVERIDFFSSYGKITDMWLGNI